MNILIDACSVINLFNAECLESICQLPDREFWIGPIVLGECNAECAQHVIALIAAESIRQVDESEIDGERFLQLLDQFNLGPGETECLAAAETLGYMVCSDDRLARNAAADLFGVDHRIGTARLLRWSVEDELMVCVEAQQRFEMMKQEGGFLPNLSNDFFCRA